MFVIKPSSLMERCWRLKFAGLFLVLSATCNVQYARKILIIPLAATKTWKYSNDVLNPLNWIGGKPSENCEGTIFPEKLGSVGSVSKLITKQLILPYSGELEIRQGGFIEVSNKDTKCIRIKELQHRHWLDPENWNSSDGNSAVPHAERVPCNYDDVVFPSDAPVAIFYPEVDVRVNSIQMGGFMLSIEQWKSFLETDYGIEQFHTLEAFDATEIQLYPGGGCDSRGGCLCHANQETLAWICNHVRADPDGPECADPIQPVGFCHGICGGMVTLEVGEGFDLVKFRERIPVYEKVEHYASKVAKDGKRVVQVVFAEGSDYMELSSYGAADFHGTIIADLGGYKVTRATLERSGIRIPKTSALRGALSIMVGTLIGSLVLSGLVYALYVGPLENYSFRSKLPFAGVSFGTFRPLAFAKLDNRGQMSMAASMVSLRRSFDNPMYGEDGGSTSSGGDAEGAVALIEQKPSATPESTHENPSYIEDVTVADHHRDDSEPSLLEITVEDIGEDVEERP